MLSQHKVRYDLGTRASLLLRTRAQLLVQIDFETAPHYTDGGPNRKIDLSVTLTGRCRQQSKIGSEFLLSKENN